MDYYKIDYLSRQMVLELIDAAADGHSIDRRAHDRREEYRRVTIRICY
jgi:hypothetical protein